MQEVWCNGVKISIFTIRLSINNTLIHTYTILYFLFNLLIFVVFSIFYHLFSLFIVLIVVNNVRIWRLPPCLVDLQ